MATSPRILFVTHNVPRHVGDAAGSFVLRLAVALQGQGAQVDVLAPGAPGLPTEDRVEDIPITRVRYASERHMTLAYEGQMAEAVRNSWNGKRALVQMLLAMRRATARALHTARREGRAYDVLHAHWWFPSGLALWHLHARRANGTPLVITMHGSDVRLAMQAPASHPIMRRVLGEASVRTAVSSWLAGTAEQIAPAAPVLVSPMPVDIRLFADAPDPTRNRQGILFVGRLNAQKGIADLIEALAHPALAAGHPDTVLHIVGDGPDRAALLARAECLGVATRLIWHRALTQSALIPLYRQSQVVAMPSRGEGLGLVAVEAQLCATPVVGYADGGLPDVVRPGLGGALVAPGNIPALADNLARVLADPTQGQQPGLRARAEMLARFSPDAVATRYLGHYRDAIDSLVPSKRKPDG